MLHVQSQNTALLHTLQYRLTISDQFAINQYSTFMPIISYLLIVTMFTWYCNMLWMFISVQIICIFLVSLSEQLEVVKQTFQNKSPNVF